MAVVISLLATALPWGPIMAFLVSSPLMSPSEFVFFAGILGVDFALALTIASVGIGLAGGYIAYALEKTTRFLDDQIRFTSAVITPTKPTRKYAEAAPAPDCGCSNTTSNTPPTACCGAAVTANTGNCNTPGHETEAPGCGCGEAPPPHPCCCESAPEHQASSASSCGCGGTTVPTTHSKRTGKLKELLHEAYEIGVKRILVYFSLFAAIGFFVNKLVPAGIIMALFNGSHWYAVPLAALVGLPLYVTGASALPLLQVLLNAGASSGAVLAFLITGPATSVGVIAGIATIMKKRAIALYIAVILIGGIVAGYSYDLILGLL